MTEEEKMLSGAIYDPQDEKLVNRRAKAHKLSFEYNQTIDTDVSARKRILKDLFPNCDESMYLQGPIQVDYGCYCYFGKNFYANFNLTILDTCPIYIGDNVYFGPNISLATPVHPMHFEDRYYFKNKNGKFTDKEYGSPIHIGNDCWIATGVTICGGVHIGDGCVIGANSVVLKDIPDNSFAAGNPCRVIRKITDADRLENKFSDFSNNKK